MRIPWKLVGLAGVAGVAATGVAVARKRRAHVDLTPEELRGRLRQRLAQVPPSATDSAAGTPPAASGGPSGCTGATAAHTVRGGVLRRWLHVRDRVR